MIEALKKLIEKEDITNFKKTFEQATVNAHHRELLFEITFRKQSLELCEYMGKKASVSNEGKVEIFIKTLRDRVKIKDFRYVEQLEDMLLATKLKDHTEALIKSQEDQFLLKFVENKPISVFMNFRRIMYFSFKYNREDFINHLISQDLDKEALFYTCLCTIKFNKKELLSDLLMKAMQRNPNVIDDMKQLKDAHINRMKLRFSFQQKDRDEVESFVSEVILQAFARYLECELQKSKPLDSTSVKQRRTKI